MQITIFDVSDQVRKVRKEGMIFVIDKQLTDRIMAIAVLQGYEFTRKKFGWGYQIIDKQ